MCRQAATDAIHVAAFFAFKQAVISTGVHSFVGRLYVAVEQDEPVG
jgi:hypothetical protein